MSTAEEFDRLLYRQPPNLPATVARVTADGQPTRHLIDWEQFTGNWFRTSVVNLNTRLVEVRSDTDGNSAAIVEETNARTAADFALAEQITTVRATVGTFTAQGQVYFGARATPAGATAAYGIYLTAGSAFTGFEMIARSDGTSAIGLSANQLYFTDSGTGTNVFSYVGGAANPYFQFNVPVRVFNSQLGDNAVSRVWFDSGSTSAAVSVNFRGSGFLEIFAQFQGNGSNHNAIDQFALRVTDVNSGAVLGDTPITHGQNGTGTSAFSRYGSTTITYIRTPSAGSRTYRAEIVKTVSATPLQLTGVLIIVKEFSK